MKKLLTKSAMLDLWRLMRADEPLRLDCTLTRTDGVDYDQRLETEMRTWYLALLDEGAEELLAPVNIAAKALLNTSADGLTVITVPEEVRRVLSLKFSDWDSPIIPDSEASEVINRAANPFCHQPMAACQSPRVILVSNARGELTELNCATDLGEETYCFDDRALEQLLNPD